MNRDVRDVELDRPAPLKQRGDHVLDNLLLGVDRDVAPRQLGDRDVQRPPPAAQVDAVVLEPLLREPLTNAKLVHEIDRVLLQQARPDSVLDVFPRLILQHYRLDPCPSQ